MPRLVDYACRFTFFREAAFAVVRDQGVSELSRRAIAHALGTSTHTVRRILASDACLAALAADEVESRRRLGRWHRLSPDPLQAALELVRMLLPDTDARIAPEFVWLRLLLASATLAVPAEQSPADLRARFHIAEHGYADAETGPDGPSPTDLAPADGRDRLRELFASHDDHVLHTVNHVLELLQVPAGECTSEAIRLRALVEGLSLAVCLGRLAPAEAVEVARDHLQSLRARVSR